MDKDGGILMQESVFRSFELASTGDLTDRTEEVGQLLRTFGVCRLGPGPFALRCLTMPEGTSLTGCGFATNVILPDDVEDGFAIRLQKHCTVKDFQLSGSSEDIELPQEVGKRHGLLWKGNYSQDKNDRPWHGTVEGLAIHGFSGGGITHYDTGYNIESGLNVSNCQIWNCCAGINIAFWSEFSRYTNVNCSRNHYGVINNGGNNTFVNCCFSGNTLGALFDNTDGTARNDSHGNFIGCLIDHSDHNNGVGIRMVNMNNGFCFADCHLFYSAIEIIGSSGVLFQGLLGSKHENITVIGGGIVTFRDISYKGQPTIVIQDNPHVRFIDCYTRSGEPILP